MTAARSGPLGVLTTKGDLPGVVTAGDLDRLAVGADGKSLIADAASTLGFKWDFAGNTVRLVSGAAIAVNANDVRLIVDVRAALATVQLPSPATFGHSLIIFCRGDPSTFSLTALRNAAEKCNDVAADYSQFSSYHATTFTPDGTDWWVSA